MPTDGYYYPGVIDRLIYPGNICFGNRGAFHESGDQMPPTSPSTATAASPPAISATSPARRRRRSSGTRMRRSWCSTAAPASRSTSIFAAPSTTCWRACRRPLPSHPPAKMPSQLPPPRGPGRPKLGVVAREITLLPRHWDWLAQQTGGASVAIRKLVEEARRDRRGHAIASARRRKRPIVSCRRWPATGRISKRRSARCSPDDRAGFEKLIAGWPADVRDHAAGLAERAFRRESAAARRLIPQMRTARLVGMIGII